LNTDFKKTVRPDIDKENTYEKTSRFMD
jgi:hypothetical protein